MPQGTGKSALVVGGTGPTGPGVVRGLLDRGFETTIFHSGTHEVALPDAVRHIHGDAHFPETIATALGRTEYDVVIVQYGRLRHLAAHFCHLAGHVIAIGGSMSRLARAADPRWGRLGRPGVVREVERHLIEDPSDGKLGFRIAEAEQVFLAAGEAGDFLATYIAYPSMFGPRQPGSSEWAIVRRLLEGRKQLILPDGGCRLESRAFVHNASRAPLLAVDQPERSAGRSYVVTDQDVYSMRQRVTFIAAHMGMDLELIDMPFEVATPAHPLYRIGPQHRVLQGEAIRLELGYTDTFDAASALAATVDWLREAEPPVIGEVEAQLGDRFDYPFEDQLISWWGRSMNAAPAESGPGYTYSHVYRHPTRPDER